MYFGMKRLILLVAALAVSAAASAQSTYNLQRRSLFEQLPVRSSDIVFLGNSITDGCEWAELFDKPRILNRGISGDRSDWMFERLDPIVAGRPKKLFLMIGTNDLAANIAPETIAANVRRILERFRKESPRTRLYVQSILPVNGARFDRFGGHYAHAGEIAPTNRLLEELCRELGVTYVDVGSALSDADGRLDSRYTNDGLHLTGTGYIVWKSVIEKYVK